MVENPTEKVSHVGGESAITTIGVGWGGVLVQDGYRIQIKAIATFPVGFRVRVDILFIIKVKVLVLVVELQATHTPETGGFHKKPSQTGEVKTNVLKLWGHAAHANEPPFPLVQ